MVRGLDTFREYFRGFENQYVLIGGAACDILFANNERQFRATRDLDMVLIVDGLTPIHIDDEVSSLSAIILHLKSIWQW